MLQQNEGLARTLGFFIVSQEFQPFLKLSMKQLVRLFIGLFFINAAFAQNIEGDWYGYIPTQSANLKLVFHIDEKNGAYVGSMDSPDYGTFGLNLNAVRVSDKKIVFDLNIFKIWFEGELYSSDSLIGTFKQGDIVFPLTLLKSNAPLPRAPNRPQEPKAPFPYKVKEVKFKNRAQEIELAGTLTLPEGPGPFPAVVLVSSSGAQNRNEEMMSHKPFWIIADYLTKNGIAVLRYDDRGVGQSSGDFTKATTADFAFDAQAAVQYLKEHRKINPSKIGIIGHSEGGMIASMVASADPQINFIVMLGAPGLPIDKMLLQQNESAQILAGVNPQEMEIRNELLRKFYDVLQHESDEEKAKVAIERIITKHKESMPKEIADQIQKEIPETMSILLSPWFRYFIQCNPQSFLQQVKCPVLAMNGSKDSQIKPVENLNGIRQALLDAGNDKIYTYIMPSLNHMMQYCDTGALSEYVKIDETISPEVLQIISDWVKTQTSKQQ